MPSKTLNEAFDYYLAHQDELVKKYNGKVIVIKDDEVIGVYDDSITAVEETQKEYEVGTFLVQPVSPGKEGHTQMFHSRVMVPHHG